METPTLVLPDFGKNPLAYFQEAKAELKKVIWPTKQDVVRMTILIVVVSVLVGAFVGGLDFGFTNLFRLIIQR